MNLFTKKVTKNTLREKSKGIVSFISDGINQINTVEEEIETFNRNLTDDIVNLEIQAKACYKEREELRIVQVENAVIRENLQAILGESPKSKKK
jgi:hypothetical protein